MQAPNSALSSGPTLRATRAVVDLDAVAANVRNFRALAPASALIAVVKGNAYGHGSVPVAETALRAGASGLAVYSVDEGIALREGGVDASILVFGPIEPAEVEEVVVHRLSPTVSRLETIQMFEFAAAGYRLDMHVKVDTGMTRAGASPRDAAELARAVAEHPGFRLASLYTHLACADEPQSDLTHRQVQSLMNVLTQVESSGVRVPMVHASNTAGALNFPEARLDAVRVGIGLYGYDPSRDSRSETDLLPALSLTSHITRVTRISRGTGVGYGHDFVAPSEAVIGLVPIGYGDGLPRQLGLGRGVVLVRGQRAPIVGRVSMDQITIDLTRVEGVKVNDEVVLIGRSGDLRQTADDLGDQAGTISYDVLTGLLPRVPRLYLQGGRVTGVARMGVYCRLPGDDR